MLTCPPSPRHFFPSPRAAAASAHLPPPQPSPELNPRNHNSKSSDLLLRHISTQHSDHPHCHVHSSPSSTTAGVSDEDRSKLLELSLIRRRTPQFPGSIYAQSPSDADVAASLPALRSLVASDADEDEMIMKAVEIRRRVTAEILKQAMMRKGKFGITYSQNMVEILGEFVDYVMIEAASLKRLPQYSDSTFNLRAMTVVEDSKVVHLMRWLKRNSVSYPQIGKLIGRTKGNLELIPRLAEWLKSVHVKGELIGPVMLKPGEKVLWRPIEELEEMVTFLEGNGVRREWMGYVLTRCPQILSMDMEELKSRVAFFVDMGMNQKDFGTMVFDYPRVLGFYSLVEMSEKVNYLKEFGISDEEVRKLLAFKPQLMGCGIEERWKPLVKYFYYFGITREGLKRVLLIKPMVFCIDIEITIVPKVKFFQDIGIRNEAIGNMLAKFPSLLTYSLYKKIRPVVIFLITRAGVTERNIGKVIAAAPELLGCSISRKLDVNMKYFLSLGIRVRQLGDMIADFPMLLRYNVELHRPKYRYLRRTMVRSLKDLIEFPRFLSYSLEDRIIPRHEVLVENRINMKLRNMLACTDEEFKKKVEAIKERRQIFESSTATSSVLQNQEEIDNDHDSLEAEKLVDWSESETES